MDSSGFERGSVYVMDAGNVIKIGCSRNPSSRALELGLELLYRTSPMIFPFRLEARVHRSLRDRRAHGEYFHLSASDAIAAIKDRAADSHINIGARYIMDQNTNWRDKAEFAHACIMSGASFEAYDAEISTIDQMRVFLSGMGITGATPSATAWNKASQDDRENALAVWQMHNLTPDQMAELSGYSYSTLRRWFKDEYPRPDNRGRRVG